MKFLLFFLLVVVVSFAHAKMECHEMSRDFYTRKLSEATKFFISSKRFPIEKVNVIAGLDCGDHVYFEFEAKPESNNVGYHWEVRLEKSTGAMVIVDGI
jgi:hypothetical protein